MDVNTLLSAALDAYEHMKLENAALKEQMVKMDEELKALRDEERNHEESVTGGPIGPL